jgi:hypothetical protein
LTIKTWTGQGGTNNGTVTTTNSGGASGDAFDGPSPFTAGAGTVTYSNTNPPFAGYMWERLQAAAGGTDRARTYHSFTAANQLSARFAFRVRQDPTAGQMLFALVNNAATSNFPVQVQLVTVSGARHLVLNVSGTQVKDFGAITFGSGAGDVYWMQLYVTMGATGTVKAKLYDDSQTLVGTEYSDTSINTGTNQFIRFQSGGNAGFLMDLDVSAISANNNSPAGYVALPTVSNVAPVATIMARPAPQEPGTVTVTGTVTDSDGTVASVAVTIVSGPNSPTVSVTPTGLNTASVSVSATFTANASARYVVRLSGIDNAGAASNNSDVTIDTYATTGDVNVYSEVSAPSWTVTGAASRLAAITDGSDSSYAESPAAPSASEVRYQMCAFRTGRDIIIKPKWLRDPSGGSAVTCVAKLYAEDNTTLVETLAAVALPTTGTVATLTFTAAALVTATDRRAPIVALSFTQ